MKKLFLDVTFATLCAALLAACGGDSGSSADSSGSDEGSSVSVPGGSSDASVYDADKNTLKDLRDGQTYRTVKIGDQVWMAENLNFVTDNSWCYGDDPVNCAKYGRLYTWAAAMDSVGEWSTSGKDCGYGKECSATSPVRGVCPKGWHLPSQAEWNALIVAVGGYSTAGSKLKSATGWSSGGNGTDTFGFSALPAGHRGNTGNYNGEGDGANFWSSTGVNSLSAYYMDLYYSRDYAYLGNNGENFGFSVRCLKD